ncbi:MAG: hypothetical protein MI975_09575 [Cytophagales bacterium]|nr:hypothetical protein [Cytophagales bacterium]
MRKRQGGYLLVILLMYVFAGCEKNDATINEELLEETAFAENVFAQLSTDVDDAVPFEGLSSGRGIFNGFGFGFGKCMTRTVDTPEDADFPKTITVEYDGACTSGFSDVVKSGKIIITLTGPPREEGSQRIVTFEDFTVNENEIRGTKTYTYNGNGQFTCTLEDGNIITKDGDVILRESTKTRTLVAGGDTEDRSDDVYEVTGVVLGETSDGTSYKKEIIEPLVIARDCFWITQGIVETTVGEATTTVNFGDGTCDDLATRTNENGEEEEFTMEMRVKKMLRHRK